jgi:type IV pilus assembly protein PilA
MVEMIKARKAELQKEGKKGFTLMEMLIVVAIIAVLIAIAIPVFTTQLDKAHLATGAANTRSELATVTATYLTDGTDITADKFVTQISTDLGSDALSGCTVTIDGTSVITVTGPGASGTETMNYDPAVITGATS